MKFKYKFILSLLLTIILLGLFFYKANLKVVLSSIKNLNFYLIFFATIINLISVYFRILRFKILLLPLKDTPFKTLFVATFGSYFISTIFPGRLGEIIKPLYVAIEEDISKISCFGCAFLDRIFDLFIIFLFFLIFLLTYDLDKGQMFLKNLYRISFLGIFFLFLLFILIYFWSKKGIRLPIFKFLNPYLEKLKEGFHSIKNLKTFLLITFLSILVWLFVSFFTFLILKSFKLDLPFFSTFMLLSVSSIGFAIPTPGGTGGVHKALQVGLVFFYSVDYNLATAISIIGHFFAMFPVAFLGFLSFLIFGIPLSKILNFAKINNR